MRQAAGAETVLVDTLHFDPVVYRNAMSRYAGHVQIVTAVFDGVKRGVTITAACSVSDNPATVLVCLNGSNANNEVFWKSGCFALNSLGSQQQPLADAFSGRTGLSFDERFAMGDWRTLITGAPVLTDAVVSFDCCLIERKAVSTHTVLFGRVVDIHFGPSHHPLIYLDRGYRTLSLVLDSASICKGCS